ncbi:uncharacterized protein LOC143035519 isoform X2 [Oratosquilla oratoria]|uniref:uncharacterized protein LOC143035519 isoform X2 n=1 Tax=Oratosquilla oratoria TaxID=337810 RepID=UPI003F76BDE7
MRSPSLTTLLLPLLSPLFSFVPRNRFSPIQSPEVTEDAALTNPFRGDGAGGGERPRRISGFASALHVVKVDVPARVQEGETVQLVCHYDLDGDNLYSLTWWRGKDQFYQFSPDSIPEVTVYTAPGIHVDKPRSGGNVVILRNVSRTSAGKYRCEVLAEHPSFEKDSKITAMEVIAVPKTAPHIEVSDSQYSPGEILEANCSSTGAAPPPKLQWLINGDKISDHHLQLVYEPSGSPRLQLRFLLRASHFQHDGRALLTCTASLLDLYYRSSEVLLTLPGIKAAAPVQKLYGNCATNRPSSYFIILCLIGPLIPYVL